MVVRLVENDYKTVEKLLLKDYKRYKQFSDINHSVYRLYEGSTVLEIKEYSNLVKNISLFRENKKIIEILVRDNQRKNKVILGYAKEKVTLFDARMIFTILNYLDMNDLNVYFSNNDEINKIFIKKGK